MRNESLENFASYLDIYTPHIYSPSGQFYNNYLELLEREKAPKYLPQLWTDLVQCEFSKVPVKMKCEILAKFGKTVKKLGSDGDSVLHKTLGHIGEGKLN